MEIDPLAALALPTPEETSRSDELGRDQFLNMLIAQLENQDPLNPQDATEFTAQLAQFSSLEQLFKIDAGIQDLQSGLGGGLDGLTSASMLGREVLLESSRFELSAQGMVTRPAFELGNDAESVKVEILQGDEVVRELTLEDRAAGVHALTDEMLGDLAPGLYDFQVRATGETGPLFTHLLVRGIVDAAVPLGGEAQLSLGQLTTPYSAVREIRLASESGE
jgi:flagellar basal-body rod modification protein FlgD